MQRLKIVFGYIWFVISIAITIYGFAIVFDEPPAGLYLMATGLQNMLMSIYLTGG